MGVAGLWDILQPAVVPVPLSLLSLSYMINDPSLLPYPPSTSSSSSNSSPAHSNPNPNPNPIHPSETQNPNLLRLGIDASLWIFHARTAPGGSNPFLRTMFFKVLKLVREGVGCLFVFDGPNKPRLKRNHLNTGSFGSKDLESRSFKALLDEMGLEWWDAPGEAEAELAHLTKQGRLDAVLTDDADALVFGARCVLRNPSKTLSANVSAAATSTTTFETRDDYQVYRSEAILSHEDVGLDEDGLILIGLMSGGDYHTAGIPKCGPKISHGIARSGLAHDLLHHYRTLSPSAFRSYLPSFIAELKLELCTNRSGFLPNKRKALADTIPDEFPNLDVLDYYVNPVVSKPGEGWLGFGSRAEESGRTGVLMPGSGKRGGRGDPRGFARACERWFEWGYKEEVGRRMRTLVWRGEIVGHAREKVASGASSVVKPSTKAVSSIKKTNSASIASDGRLTSYFTQASSSGGTQTLKGKEKSRSPSVPREYGSFPPPRLINISATREHPSTGFTVEYRVEYDPSEWNAVTLDAMDGTRLEPRYLTGEQRVEMGMVSQVSQSDIPSGSEVSTGNDSSTTNATPRKKREKMEVDLASTDKAWVPATLIKRVWPDLVEVYEEKMRAKAEKAATPKKKRATKAIAMEKIAPPSRTGFLSGWLTGKANKADKKADSEEDEVEEVKPRTRLQSLSPELEVVELPESPEVVEDPNSRRTITGRSAAAPRRYPTPPPEYAHIPFRTPSPEVAMPKKKGSRPALSISSSSNGGSDAARQASNSAPEIGSTNKPSPRKSPRTESGASATRRSRIRSPSPTPKPKVVSKVSRRRPSAIITAGPPGRRLPSARRNSDVIDLTDSDDEANETPEMEGSAKQQLKPKHWAEKPKPLTQYFGQAATTTGKPVKKPSAPGYSSSTSFFDTPGKDQRRRFANASSAADLGESDSSESELESPRALLKGLKASSTAHSKGIPGTLARATGGETTSIGRRGSFQDAQPESDRIRGRTSHTDGTNRKRRSGMDLLPLALLLNDRPLLIIRRLSLERGLFHGSVILAVWRLVAAGESQVAGELAIILLLSLGYIRFRSLGRAQPHGPMLRPLIRTVSQRMFRPISKQKRTARTVERDHTGAVSVPDPTLQRFRLETGWRPPQLSRYRFSLEEEIAGCRGRVWATDEKDYRECIDDGAAYAFLLGPLLGACMFYDAWTRLATSPDFDRRTAWEIERPIVLDTTPNFTSSRLQTIERDPATLARVALALSRRHLIHLTCMLSLALGVHIFYSRSLEGELLQAEDQDAAVVRAKPAAPLLYWSKRGEWRRTAAIILFAMWVMIGFVSIKAGAHYMDWTAAYDLTYTDIILSILFFQFCLYICVRLARRGFTLGELGVVCHAATGLFMETINLTRMKISVFRTPYVRTYRMATPLVIFQLALIPGSFLTGVLLSPVLVLSRKIARKPEYRMRSPLEKQAYRKALAAAFYGGSAIICGGIIGYWTRWCLGGRNPFGWVIMWCMSGSQWWSRPALMAYWGLLAAISVAGWTRQLVRARRKRAWTESSVSSDGRRHLTVRSSASGAAGGLLSDGGMFTPRSESPMMGQPRKPSMASQVMDNMDHRLPTFSINARRKYFHALAVVLFVPGMVIDPAFTHLACSVAFAAFTFAEYIRYFAVYPFGAAVHLFLNEFLDSKDSGTAIMSHFYLLTGCAAGLWLEGPATILNLFGVLALGVGDALASIVGKRYGRVRWSTSGGKTVEGSVAFFVSVLASGCLLRLVPAVQPFSVPKFGIVTALVAIMEAASEQNDNLILPIWGWCLGVLIGV